MAGSTVCAFAAAIVWHTHRTTAETEAQAPTKGVPSSQGIQTDSNPSPFICQVEEAREGRGRPGNSGVARDMLSQSLSFLSHAAEAGAAGDAAPGKSRAGVAQSLPGPICQVRPWTRL